MSLKVSDEFTVPLCRLHHPELHQAGNEKAWWDKRNLRPLETNEHLWKEKRAKMVRAIGGSYDTQAHQVKGRTGLSLHIH